MYPCEGDAMTRLGDIHLGDVWPANGKHRCVCVATSVERPPQGNAYLALTWTTADAKCRFTDRLYLTQAASPRLNVVLLRVCAADPDMQVPDEADDAIAFMVKQIQDSIEDRWAMVEIQEKPNAKGELRKKVAFAGYEPVEPADPEPAQATKDEGTPDDLPF